MDQDVSVNNQPEKKQRPKVDMFEKRIHEIDFFRGILIFLVVFDHIMIDIYHLPFDHSNQFWQFFNWYIHSTARDVIQPLALFGFCFVSGISCAFSKNNLKRAIVVLIIWAVLFIGSNILSLMIAKGWISGLNDPEVRVDFNIIGVLGFCMLTYALIQKKSWRSIAVVALVSFYLTTYFIPWLRQSITYYMYTEHGVIPFQNYRPGNYWYTDVEYWNGDKLITNPIPKFYLPFFWEPEGQADYVSLFPYSMFFFAGALLSYFTYKKNKKSLIPHKGQWERPICFIGRHTLIIYGGQFVVLTIVFNIIRLFM